MRLLDAAFDVLRRAGEPLSPSEIVRQIKSARIEIDANESLDDETVKVELEHITDDGANGTGIVRTASGRFTLPSFLDRTFRTATSTASTINPLSIASSIARANVGAVWTLQDATKEVLRRAKRPLSVSEIATLLHASGVLRGSRSDDESNVRSQLIQEMLQHGGESTFVRVGNNTYSLRYHSVDDAPASASALEIDREGEREFQNAQLSEPDIASVDVAAESRLARDIAGSSRTVSAKAPETDDLTLLRRIRTLTNQRFERFIVVFLASLGMTDVKVINRTRPGELDIHATMSIAEVMDVRFTVQALNWHRHIHGGDVQLLRGGMRIGDHGLVITTSEFQRGAHDEANREGAIPIATINGNQMVKLAKERGAAKLLG